MLEFFQRKPKEGCVLHRGHRTGVRAVLGRDSILVSVRSWTGEGGGDQEGQLGMDPF